MAGLALKGILYGVDKIPDNWFDKIPYYQSEEAKAAKKAQQDVKKKNRRNRRASADDKHRGERRHGERRGRSHDDEGSYDDGDDDHRRGSGRYRGTDDGRYRYDGVADGNIAQPRAHRPSEFPVNSVPPPPMSNDPTMSPYANGFGSAQPPPINTRVAGYNDHVNDERRDSSGPVQGYVPYAHIYHSPSNSPRDSRFDQPMGRKGSLPVNGGSTVATGRPPVYDEPRAFDHRSRRDSRYDSDGYDSEEDERRRRRRHHGRARSQGASRSDSRDRRHRRGSKYDR